MSILKNARHERFVQELIRGRSQCDAYLAAGYKASSPSAAYAHAARLVRNGQVRARLNELQSKEEIMSLLTMEKHMEELRVLREMAKERCQFASAIRAEELRGKLRGFYVEKVEHGNTNELAHLTDEQLRDLIIQDAKALGIDFGQLGSQNLGRSTEPAILRRKSMPKTPNRSAHE